MRYMTHNNFLILVIWQVTDIASEYMYSHMITYGRKNIDKCDFTTKQYPFLCICMKFPVLTWLNET